MTIRWNADSLPGEITLRIPTEVVTASMQGVIERKPVPETVTQESVFELFGLRSKTYLRFARAGRFPNNKIGSLRVALYEDVRAFLTCRPDVSKPTQEPALYVSGIDHLAAIRTMTQSTKTRKG